MPSVVANCKKMPSQDNIKNCTQNLTNIVKKTKNKSNKIFPKFSNNFFNNSSSSPRSLLSSFPTSEQIKDRLKLSVGGQRFEISRYLVEKFPSTLLGSPNREKYYVPEEDIYHFDRHPVAFLDILYFYQSEGKHLEKSDTLSNDIYLAEMDFFKLPFRPLDRKNTMIALDNRMPIFINERKARSDSDHLSKYEKTKLKIWAMAEDPNFNSFAKIYALTSTFLIMVSVVTLIIETVDSVVNNEKYPNAEWIQKR